MVCEMDCFKCEHKDCINNDNLHDKITDEIDLEERLERRWSKARTPQERYLATKKGHAKRLEVKRRYENKNLGKRALWSFRTRTRREKGYDPSEEECLAFLKRNGYEVEYGQLLQTIRGKK